MTQTAGLTPVVAETDSTALTRFNALIREQAYGEALDPFKLEKLGRYEVHLDRKLARMLAMLIKLQDLRQPVTSG